MVAQLVGMEPQTVVVAAVVVVALLVEPVAPAS
jgi:hypothetical protein